MTLFKFAIDLSLNILLETAHHQPFATKVFLVVVLWIGDCRWIKHIHQAGKALGSAIVRSCREHDQGIGTGGEALSQPRTLTAVTTLCDVVTLIDNDDVPVGLLQIDAVLGVLLESINGDDRFIVVVKRVVIGWNATAYSL